MLTPRFLRTFGKSRKIKIQLFSLSLAFCEIPLQFREHKGAKEVELIEILQIELKIYVKISRKVEKLCKGLQNSRDSAS